jgi:hypothetical protein
MAGPGSRKKSQKRRSTREEIRKQQRAVARLEGIQDGGAQRMCPVLSGVQVGVCIKSQMDRVETCLVPTEFSM